MSTSQLIARLQELQEQHGDIEVVINDGDNEVTVSGPEAVQVDIHERLIRIDLTA